MARQIALLRGINVGSANRIAMTDLRAAVTAAGLVDVRTHLQSGNVIADGDPEALLAAIRAVLDVPCVLRSAEQLEAAIRANPLAELADETPKLFQVTFWAAEPGAEVLERLRGRRAEGEEVVVHGREVYSFHPDGIARSRLGLALTPAMAVATARNWNTVLKLAELARA